MTALDRSSPLPLWAQLAAQLGARVSAHEFDERFPTDSELVAQYAVSRHTVREAVRHLGAAGIVERHRGRGSFVRSGGDIEQSLGSLYSLAQSLTEQGFAEESVLLARGQARHTEAAQALGLAPDAELLHIRRLRHAAGAPLSIDDSWLPWDFGAALLSADLSKGSIYERLESEMGLRVTGGHERIRVAQPDAETRATLALPDTAAVFVVERLATAGARPVEWRRSVIRGDRFSFTAAWSSDS